MFLGVVLTSQIWAFDKPELKPDKPDAPSVPDSLNLKPEDDHIGDVPGSSCPPQVSIGKPSDVDEDSKPKPSDDNKPDGGSISQ